MAAENFEALNRKSLEIKFDLDGTNYEAIENIGTGAYGVVCSAANLSRPGERVAIKKIPDIFGQTTVAMRTYREIKILKHFRHENIISIREMLKPRDEDLLSYRDVYIVLDLMESDLHRIIHSRQDLTDEHIRYFLYQILRGLKYIHSANVVHRDLKPSNLLVNENCLLKIGDFGMARGISSNTDDYNFKMTQYVATRWYRAPELMLLPLNYTASIDVWSVGCILAEMLGRKQLFPGREYKHQLQLIFDVVGAPSEEYINRTSDIIRDFLRKFPKKAPANLAQLYPTASPKAMRLLARMLKLNPEDRLSVEDALRDPYLSKYHDVDDEPVCMPVFDFSFEKARLDSDALRAAITKEIMSYHQPRVSLLTFDLRPVPRDELEQSAATQPPLPSTSVTGSVSDVLKQPMDPLMDYFSSGSSSNRLAVEAHCWNSESIDMVSATALRPGSDVDNPDGDTVMPSAGTISDEQNGQCQLESGQTSGSEPDQNSLTDAKALIKAALLNSERRKQQLELSRMKPVVKVTTALQRQKEREEKRRRKKEKAQEKSRRNQQKGSLHTNPLLTDEDRNLLQRWQNMARNTQTPLSTTSDDPVWSSPSYNVKLDPVTRSTNSSSSNSPTVCLNPETPRRLSLANGASMDKQTVANLVADGYFQHPLQTWLTNSVGSTLSQAAPVFVHPQLNSFNAGFVGYSDILTYAPIAQPSGALLPTTNYFNPPVGTGSIGEHQNDTFAGYYCTLNSDHQQQASTDRRTFSDLNSSKTYPSGPLLTSGRTSSFTEPMALQPEFTKHHQDIPLVVESSELGPGATLRPSFEQGSGFSPSIGLATQSISEGDDTFPQLSLIKQDTMPTVALPHGTEALLNSLPETFDRSVGHQYVPQSDSMLPVAISPQTTKSLPADALQIITTRLMKSHMEDLTLTHTPRGTGVGYGVGDTFDSCNLLLSGNSVDLKAYIDGPESAPLSATLMADWRDVTGDLDASEFEAVLREMGSTTRINLNDFNSLT